MSDFSVKGHLAMLGANVMWGLMAPVTKLLLTATVITPLILVDFRIAGAAMLFWITSIFGKTEHVPPRDLLLLAGAGMLGVLLNQGCFIFGVGLTSPGEASIITTTMPMWVMVLAWLILHEPITGKKIGGIALGAAGALILVFSGLSRGTRGDNPVAGDIIVMCAQMSYALYLTLYKNFIRKYSLVTLMKWMFTFATIGIIPFSIPSIMATDWPSLSLLDWSGVAYVVVFATFIAYICIMIGQKNLRPTVVGMYNYVQPVVSTMVGICLGLDSFNFLKVVAVVLIFGGVYLVTISKSRADILKNLSHNKVSR
ncbi:MAG: DMT family transporter [Clostridiales bacterium]|nr:DMT family transporter [Clostridiales bacterium]